MGWNINILCFIGKRVDLIITSIVILWQYTVVYYDVTMTSQKRFTMQKVGKWPVGIVHV